MLLVKEFLENLELEPTGPQLILVNVRCDNFQVLVVQSLRIDLESEK